MEANKISRLRAEQQKAMSETEEKLMQFEKYKSDYQTLQKRLETLPDKISHDVMVPFGKLAFMPGQLVHTNEILVLLGDNWFAERSAKQASDIAGRRIKELDSRIQELKDQKSLLEPRLGMTSELQAVAEGRGDYREIIEEYDEEKEKQWDEQHKINVRLHHDQMRKLRNDSDHSLKSKQEVCEDEKKVPELPKTEKDLWSRLDSLEREEEERGELNSSFESDDEEGQMEGTESKPEGLHSTFRDKRVNWGDTYDQDSGDDDDDDGSDEEDDDDDEEDEDPKYIKRKTVVKTITFSHTKTPALHPIEPRERCSDGVTNITSPAEIYKLFSPKSILKKSEESFAKSKTGGRVGFPDHTGDHSYPHLHDRISRDGQDELDKTSSSEHLPTSVPRLASQSNTSREKAFTGIIKENTTPTPTSGASPTSQATTTTTQSAPNEQPRRVSKFKAQRMGHNPPR